MKNKKTKVHFAEAMPATPFQTGRMPNLAAMLADRGVDMVAAPDEADVIVARVLSALAGHYDLNRQYYLWTHEPNLCVIDQPSFFDISTGRTIHVSTAFNGDVYIGPLYYFPYKALDAEEMKTLCREKSKSCAILATYRAKFDRYLNNTNVDLTEYRQRLAMDLHFNHDGFSDIYGRGWPEPVKVVEESRGAGWQEKKHGIIADYRFNLALENTLAKNYVTEKLWQAISAACVPIVFAEGSGMTEVVRSTSYVDAGKFKTSADLHEFLAGVSDAARMDYVMSAYEDYSALMRNGKKADVIAQVIDRFCDRVRAMV